MSRLKIEGLADYSKKLLALGKISATNRVIKTAIYDGAAIAAAEMSKQIDSIPTVPAGLRGSPENKINGISETQKRGLEEGLGIATMKQGVDGWNTKVSFDGYNDAKTRKYPSGQPNAIIAASVEGGTSFRVKNPFITRAIRNCKARAEAAMAATAEEQINQIMEES